MLTKQKILDGARKQGKIRTGDFTADFHVSRQYVSGLIRQLVSLGELIKIGSTQNAFYVLPEYARMHPEILPDRFVKTFKNSQLEEHKVLLEIEEKLPQFKTLAENVRSIFTFAFSEMLNNAIEHSGSKNIFVEVVMRDGILSFMVKDSGIGAFRNIMRKRKLKSETEAILDLLKGKTTTMPKSHSGEGIFFTSKSADQFLINSFGYVLDVQSLIPDVAIREESRIKKGTHVQFSIAVDSRRHLSDVFKKYTNLTDNSDYGFDKTEIRVKLFTSGGVHISRSQARRILSGLEKFKIILFDYENISLVGQAFADEIYRVFQERYPGIRLENEHMNDRVRFMIERAKNEAKRKRHKA